MKINWPHNEWRPLLCLNHTHIHTHTHTAAAQRPTEGFTVKHPRKQSENIVLSLKAGTWWEKRCMTFDTGATGITGLHGSRCPSQARSSFSLVRSGLSGSWGSSTSSSQSAKCRENSVVPLSSATAAGSSAERHVLSPWFCSVLFWSDCECEVDFRGNKTAHKIDTKM